MTLRSHFRAPSDLGDYSSVTQCPVPDACHVMRNNVLYHETSHMTSYIVEFKHRNGRMDPSWEFRDMFAIFDQCSLGLGKIVAHTEGIRPLVSISLPLTLVYNSVFVFRNLHPCPQTLRHRVPEPLRLYKRCRKRYHNLPKLSIS